MKLGRRGFLQAVPAAIASAPVAAKAAAQKMGLVSAASASGLMAGGVEPQGFGPAGIGRSGHWAERALKEFMSRESVQQRRDQARSSARTLDPDLAAMHSLSPAVAFDLQFERCYRRITENQKRYFEREVAEFAKQKMGLG